MKTSIQNTFYPTKPDLIFLGNGPLAVAVKTTLETTFNIIFHAHTKEDLETVKKLKQDRPELPAVLASFGVIIKPDLLKLFEPTGILNIHPSLLPKYRGPSPIESAIIHGDKDFGVSIMKLTEKMDAGPIYYQEILPNLPLDKAVIYKKLATAGATWLCNHFRPGQTAPQGYAGCGLPVPTPQDDAVATYTKKLTADLAYLSPETNTRATTLRKIVAYQTFPKPKYIFFGHPCIILSAHLPKANEIISLPLQCQDGALAIDQLQPLGKRPMDAQSFLNGYAKR